MIVKLKFYKNIIQGGMLYRGNFIEIIQETYIYICKSYFIIYIQYHNIFPMYLR